VIVTSPQISLEEYVTVDISLEKVINIMVCDLQRIIEYPKKGFQIHQFVPDQVLDAFHFLVSEGFNRHLIKE